MKEVPKKSKKSSAPKPVIIKPESKEIKKKVYKKVDTPDVTPIKIRDFRPIKIALIALGIILAFCVLSAIVFNNSNNSKMDAYINSKAFADYSVSMKSYLQANSGVYPTTYSCAANSAQLWTPPTSPLSKKKEALEVQLARQLIDLKPKWEAASKTFPGYSDFFLFKVIPLDHSAYKRYQNAADLMDRSSALVNHTEDYTYYCPGFLYPGMDEFSYLSVYAANKPITDSQAVIEQHMKALVVTGNTFAKAKTPADWQATQKAYIAFLHSTLADLTELRNQNLKNPGGTNMSAKFSADKKQFEITLAQAKKAGLKIGPDQKQLAKLYYETIK